MKKIAIIGGSGLEDPAILKEVTEVNVETPYGAPSSSFKCGKIGGVEVAILSRHGRDHSIPPSTVNNRANIWAIKELGCTHILATTACGSLRLEIGRGDIVMLDQFIDFTRFRKNSFVEEFEDGQLNHPAMADPFNWHLRQALIENAKALDLGFHKSGTVITIEGPRFSTRAESNMFRVWGADVINMSTAPECALANELEIPYAAVALSTDYDCWNVDEAPVTWEEVLNVFNENVKHVIALLQNTITSLQKQGRVNG
ncbi:5'-methylthioadenosine phosphorylase [Draconibacterium orientale]|uniref:Purine nucleoside phosphorylase n=1 Tax=Draconibacterium orientale TaxID=1168034 RepID=X5DYG6_9BACT|nr:S-methyl-5'-thioadenosine phosphorylase [Draconibacterium orientale]AHW59331.1 5'-methylthioadenosine phosphorylase [Draconibacterium orientale]SET83510.1 5'-methylthioadenosine phosphorylase [Draconibacterium orientale]